VSRWRACAAGACALLMSWSSLGLADEYDALVTRAVAAKERARETNDPGQWLEASQLFQQADAMRSTPETKYELGYAAEHLRQVDLAVELYETCLEQGITGRARDHARAFVDQHVASLGRLELAGAAGTTVRIGGLVRGTLPMPRPILVFPGKVRLELVDPGGSERARTVDVRAGEVSRVDVAASEVKASPSSPPTAPATAAPHPPPASPAAPIEQRSSSTGVGLGLLITGSVLVVASGTTLVVAGQQLESTRQHLASVCKTSVSTDQCLYAGDEAARAQAQSDADAIATWKAVRTGAFVGLGVGLVSAGVGALLWGTNRGKAKPPMQAKLELGPRGWSLALGARF
jgi:hypothetical protein